MSRTRKAVEKSLENAHIHDDSKKTHFCRRSVVSWGPLLFFKSWFEMKATKKFNTVANANKSDGPPSYLQNSQYGETLVEDFHFHSADLKTAAKEI